MHIKRLKHILVAIFALTYSLYAQSAPQVPFDLPKFQPILSECRLHSPSTSPATVSNGNFGGYELADRFFLGAGGTTMILGTTTNDNGRSELRHNSTWSVLGEEKRLSARLRFDKPVALGGMRSRLNLVQVYSPDLSLGPFVLINWRGSWEADGEEDHLGVFVQGADDFDLGPRPEGFFDLDVVIDDGILRVYIDNVLKGTRDVSHFSNVGAYFKAGNYHRGILAHAVEYELLSITRGAPKAPASFTASAMSKPDATAFAAYSGTLTDYTNDPENEQMVFVKASGPAWLNVASNGALSGMPTASDVGLNTFTIELFDSAGNFDSATLEINVEPALSTNLLAAQFGSDFDGYAGFNTGGNGTFTEQADSINFNRNFDSASNAFLYTTNSSLNTNAGSSYTFTSVVKYNSSTGSGSARNVSMVLFSGNTNGAFGITLKMQETTNTFQIDTGLNQFDGPTTSWGGASFASGATFTLEGIVYFTADDVHVVFNLSDDAGFSASTTRTIARSALSLGSRHGVGTRNSGLNFDAKYFVINDNPSATPPSGLVATASETTIALDWADNPEGSFVEYSIYRSNTSGSYGSPLVTGLSTSEYVDSSVAIDTTYYYVVTATDILGRESALSSEVFAATPLNNAPPTADAGPDQVVTDGFRRGRERVYLDGSNSSDVDGTIISYVWTLDGSQIATGVNPSVIMDVGTHTVTLTVTDNYGATGSDTVTITVNVPPIADAGSDQVATAGSISGDANVTLDGSGSNDSDGNIVSYVWTLGGSQIATGANPTVTLGVGSYTITLTVTDNDGATDTDTVNVTVIVPVDPVSYDFGTGAGQTTFGAAGFTAASEQTGLTITDGSDHVSFRRNGGDNNQRGGITKKFDGLGNGAMNDFTITAEFTYHTLSRNRLQLPGSILLFASGQTENALRNDTGLGVHFYADNSSPYPNDSLRITTSPITESGPATVLWNPTNDSNIRIREGDVMQWVVDVIFSGENMTIVATLSRTGGTYPGRTNEELLRSVSISHTVLAADYVGNEYFGFGGRWGGSSDTRLHSFSVIPFENAAPVADAGPDQTVTDSNRSGSEAVTLDGSASFDPDGSIVSYVWSVDGSQIATGVNPTVTFSADTYLVTLTVTDDLGATATGTVTITVNSPPVADAGVDQVVTDTNGSGDAAVTLDGSNSTDADGNSSNDAEGSIAGFVWSAGSSQIATGETPTVALSVGTHVVTLTVIDNNGTTDTDTVTITVNAAPLAAAGPDQVVTDDNGSGDAEISLDGSASTDPDGSIVSYVWSVGGSQIATGATPTVTLGVGTHVVTLAVTDNLGASATDTVTITVNAPPVAIAGVDQVVTDTNGSGNAGVTLDGSASTDPDGSIVSYVWSVGGNQIATGATPTVTLSVGTHVVTLTVTDNNGAADTDTVTITVNVPPVAAAGPDQVVTDDNGSGDAEISLDGSASTDPDGSIVSYVWSVGGSQIATGATPTVTLGVGTHVVTLAVTDNLGASATDTVTITVNAPPVADAGPDQVVTDTNGSGNAGVTLDGSASTDPDGSIVSYVWSVGGNQIATGATPTVTLSVGTHVVTLTVTDNNGAADTDTVTITVNVPPVADAGSDQTVTLSDSAPWTPGDIAPAAWYDASDSSTIQNSGGSVSQWNDKSGHGKHAVQATPSRQPSYQASDPMINNLPSIGNIGASGQVGLATPSLAAKTVYMVTYYKDGLATSFDGYSTLLSGPGSWGQYRVMGNVGSANFIGTFNFNDAGTYKNGASSSSQTVLGMSASIFKFKSSALRTQTWALGYNQQATDRDWQGAYSEIIFTDGTEGSAAEQKIEGYLAHKWGLEGNLPSAHPYKSAAPGTAIATATLGGSASGGDGNLVTTWSVVSGPGLVSFADSGAVNTTATFSEVGTYVLRLTVDDGTATSYDDLSVTVAPPNQPPVFTSDPIVKTNATEDAAYSDSIAGDASDPESDPLTFSKASGPAWLSVAANGDLSGTPGSGDLGLNSFTVEVSDGNGGTDQATLEITVDAVPSLLEVKINFQPAGSPVPSGYLVDSGSAFGDRGNGFSYGWDVAVNETRERSNHGDLRYATLNHMQKTSGRYWEIELPNGDYDVFLVMGDSAFTDQINTISVEGVIMTDPDGFGNFDTYQLTVTVTDGRLTLIPAAGSQNAKLCFIEITSVNPSANQAPAFTSDPVVKANATEGVAYSDSIAGDAADPDSDPLSFSKVSGPAWLSVAANGDLSGTPGSSDVGMNSFTVAVADGNGGSDQTTLEITVVPANSATKLVRTTLSAVGNQNWMTVDLGQSYTSAVVIATPVLPNHTHPPVVTRVRNVSGSNFDIIIERLDGQSGTVAVDVHVVAVEEGVYTQAEHGVTMEAVKYMSTITARKGSWVSESQTYQNTYTNPVVVGQVMSANDPAWSVFWSHGTSPSSPADAANLNTGKHVGEDPNTSRVDETIGYIVIEAGSGSLDGINFVAGVGSNIVRGPDNSSTGYTYNFSGLSTASVAALSLATMNGIDGAFAVLAGANALTSTSVTLWADEDQLSDNERLHTTEQAAYLIME